ncbi:uncharacterized protein [Primulina huaijiensis]|uniref:uncharacterized protein isoform X1 n=1 Tax=Primulina huaijiensis TaxID=1492673 RepID=UPI003CC762FE
MQAHDAAVSHSPSSNGHSNSDLTEIAARAVEEYAAEEKSDEFYDDEFYFEREVDSESVKREGGEWDGDEDDQGFEFEFVTRDSESSTISADEIFHDGKIRPVYPFLNGDLVIRKVNMDANKEENGKKTIRLPLMKLLIEERETAATSSCSSSDVDDLEGVPEEMYCVWQPKAASDVDEQESVPEEMYCVWPPKPTPEEAESPEETARRCKKSTSTGSIYKKLKLKELLSRSHSEGRKENFVFLTPKNSWNRRENEYRVEEQAATAGKLRPPPPRRTYLPYRQDLVGFFSGGNGLTKNSKPF